jgi:preprotein translocase subunit SecA
MILVSNKLFRFFMNKLLTSIFQFVYRLRHGITLSNSRFEALVKRVNSLAEQTALLSDTELRNQFAAIRQNVQIGASLDEVAVDAFSIIREVAWRTVSMRPYDVQMLAAFALQAGKCVEMQTGEGKTLAAAVAISLRALTGLGAHVLTFNDYLAERDAKWMAPIFQFLGLTFGYVGQHTSKQDRQTAYGCDITYVTAKEAGFDFLRDQLCQDPVDRVHRGFHFAIADEADSILIDEARVPMVIATEDETDGTDLYHIAKLVRPVRSGVDYEVKNSGRNISFTDSGLSWLENKLGVAELHSEDCIDLLARLNLALQAQVLVTRDVDYMVREGRIELIDEFTGRVAENRKWPGGLQAAIEAKEGLAIQPQGRILNSITLQQFVGMYDFRAGMTGTAVEATEEFDEFYNMTVVIIPPNQPCVRVDHEDRIFATQRAKRQALVQEVRSQHETGRPLLIGTASVSESELVAGQLREVGIECRVLNAANDHLEAEIIAEAGALHAVTISTNMAGRGTDICLGGSHQLDRLRVVELGGLYVIGTNRHESRRIDNQLRGRSGRQGDPGLSRFFVSLQDDLISRHGIAQLVSPPIPNIEQPIDDAQTASRIGHVQRVIEGESFEIRRTLRKYSLLLEVQRRTISKFREEILTKIRIPTALKNRNPELREQLVSCWGEELIAECERKVSLIHIDWCWSDHLAHAAEIRANIHMVSLGGLDAFDTFNKEMHLEFQAFLTHIDDKVAETMSTASITAKGIDLEKESLRAPSSTWTFMINDNPRGDVLSQIIRGVASRLNSVWK